MSKKSVFLSKESHLCLDNVCVYVTNMETTNITEYDNYKTEISSLVGTG